MNERIKTIKGLISGQVDMGTFGLVELELIALEEEFTQAYSQTPVSVSVCYCGKPSVEECEPCCSLACALKPKMYR
jgi:hypothetical protein